MLNFGLFQQSHIFIYHRLYSATLHLLASARRVIVRRIGPQISTPQSKARKDSTPYTPASGGQTPHVETKKDAFPGISCQKRRLCKVLITVRLR